MRRLLLIYFVLLTSAHAKSAEDVFEAARDYTVQIRTAINLPFAGDKRMSSIGAGFLVDAERGWIMTNAHVVGRSPSRVMVTFRGKPYQTVSKVYVDPYIDVAIIKTAALPGPDIRAAELDCGELPDVGQAVGAFGHPWGLSYTGTRGIISGTTSKLGTEMLQTDAPINGGNSGGPLISLETGKIVGISTAKWKDREDQNTNFATPMKYACRIISLLQKGQDPSPPELATVFIQTLDELERLVVAKTYLGADELPLRPGDVIRRLEDVPGEIRNESQLIHTLRGRLDNVSLFITRDGKPMRLTGQLRPVPLLTERKGLYVSGMLIAPSSLRDNRELNLNYPLMVHHVAPGSLGSSLEIAQWDFIENVDGKAVEDLDDLYSQLASAQTAGKTVSLVLKRWSHKTDRVYEYLQRTVMPHELKLVGMTQPQRLAAH